MSDKLPHEKHHEVAQTLFRTFYEALEGHLNAKGYVTRAEIDKAFSLMEDYWPKVLPLFTVTCKVCAEQRERHYNPDARRKDFLTRFVFSHIVTHIPVRMDPVSGKNFPHVIVRGIQKNMTTIFYEKEYEALNAQAQQIFSQIGTDDDKEVWELIAKDDTLQVAADKIFVRLLLRFKQFNHQRQVFTKKIVQSVEGTQYTFTDLDFCTLFNAIFGKFEQMLQTEDGRIKIDLYFGEETSEKLAKIFFMYSQFKQQVDQQAQMQNAKRNRVYGR